MNETILSNLTYSLIFNSHEQANKLRVRTNQTEKIIIYIILFILASIGNTTSFIALLFMNKKANRNFKSSSSRIRLLLMNLCIADLMVTYIHLPLEIIWAITDSWLAGEFMCKLMMFLRTFGLYLSSFVIITITIDRYYVIVKPLELEKVYSLNKIFLSLSWIMSFLSSLPQVFLFEILQHPNDSSFKQCVTFVKLNTQFKKLIYSLYHFIGCYGAPLLIMIYCYFKIFHTIATHTKSSSSSSSSSSSNLTNKHCCLINKKSKELRKCENLRSLSHHNHHHQHNSNNNQQLLYLRYKYRSRSFQQFTNYTRSLRSRTNLIDRNNIIMVNENLRRSNNNTFMKAKYRTLKLSALIVLAFLFSWTPYYLCVLWAIVNPNAFNTSFNRKLRNYLFTFSVSNSCLNPYIYGIFLNKLYRFLPCMKKKRMPKPKETRT